MKTTKPTTETLKPAHSYNREDNALLQAYQDIEDAKEQYREQIHNWDAPDDAKAMLNVLNKKLYEAVEFFMSYGHRYPAASTKNILPPVIIYKLLLHAQQVLIRLEQQHQENIKQDEMKEKRRSKELRELAELEGAIAEEEERNSRNN